MSRLTKKAVRAVIGAPKPVQATIRYSTNDNAWAIVDPKKPQTIVEVLDASVELYMKDPVFSSVKLNQRVPDGCGSFVRDQSFAGVATGTLYYARPKSLEKTTDFVNFRFGTDGAFTLADRSTLVRAKWLALGGKRFATVKVYP